MNTTRNLFLAVAAMLIGSSPSHALDTWSTVQGVLNIPLVKYGTKTYQNVTAVLGGVISVGSTCSSASTTADTLNATTGQLAIAAVTVTTKSGSTTYCDAQVWLSSITSVGGVCADTNSCAQYFTPISYASTMPRSYAPNLTLLSGGFTNRARYLVSDSPTPSTSAHYLTIGNDYNTSVSSGYPVSSSLLPLSSTYKTYLNKLIQVVAVADNGTNATVYNIGTSGYTQVGYRLDSHLHPNESIDVDTTNGNRLKFARNIGAPPVGTAFTKTTAMTPIVTTDGFIAFSYDSSTHTLQALKRYIRSVVQDVSTACTKAPCYNAKFTITTFPLTGYYVKFSEGIYSLVQTLPEATPFYFYSSSDGYAVPSSLNPTNTPYTTTNPPAAFPTSGSNSTSGTTQSVVSVTETTFTAGLYTKYLDQVSIGGIPKPGANESTKIVADAFLQTVKTDVESNTTGNNGVSCLGKIPTGTLTADQPQAALRYSPSVYTAFRDALLSSELVSDAVADGTPNQKLVPFVYFTNEQDSYGCYHPFMVIVTYGQSSGPHGLLDVPVPPAAGASTAAAGMTRLTNLVGQTVRIPMRNYGNINLTNMTTINNATNVPGFTTNLCTDKPSSCPGPDAFNWASSNDNGISYDGAQTFPIMNASVIPSNWKAELSTYGCHVGQGGGGAHCHADGYVAGTTNKLTLYSDSDYIGRTHPPLVAFAYDGIATFGRYRAQDTTMIGANEPLDDFSGHNHDGIGYHYHARETDMPISPMVYTYTDPDNTKTVCSALDPKCKAGFFYGTGNTIATPTKVNTLVQGAWKANLQNIPCFRGSGSSFNGTLCKAFVGQN